MPVIICGTVLQPLQFYGPDTPGIWVQTGKEDVAMLCSLGCATL